MESSEGYWIGKTKMWYDGHDEPELENNDGSADDNAGADADIALKKFLRRQLLW